MSSTFGENIKLTVFGESHSAAIGMTLEGVPAGEVIDEDRLREFMARRAPGRDKYSTGRKEDDIPEFVSGVLERVTTGSPITAVIRNSDTRSRDYDDMKKMPRPSHADYSAHVKYGGNEDYRGGGHFSGRLTAPVCAAGGIILQILERKGITVEACATEIAGIETASLGGTPSEPAFETDSDAREKALKEIENAKAEGDSVGGVITCVIKGVRPGIGDPMFGGVENVMSQALFGIPAVKGIEFGAGFGAARKKGSENNDPFTIGPDGGIVTTKNDSGGILGGITSGMPIVFRVAVKPTPSIAKEQDTVTYGGEKAKLTVKGRHDPCIALRAVPVVEAMAAVALYDMILGE